MTAKFVHSYLIFAMGLATAATTAWWVLQLKPTQLAVAAALAMVAGVSMTAVGMMIDLARPLLDWTNPQKAIKQNLNVLFAILADIGFLTAFYFISKLLAWAGLSASMVLVVLLGVLVVLSTASVRLLLRFAEKRYVEIEV